jgi:tetratricopeptide (TPR) repeat protein
MPGALSAFQEAIAIARDLAANDPSSSERQNDLSVSLLLAGHTMKNQGFFQDALAINRENVDILRSLTAGDRGNTAWQRQLSAALHEMGEALWAKGDVGDALAYYREGLNVIRALLSKDFDNAVWQNEVSRSLDRIGDLLKAQGDLNAALAHYRENLNIIRKLAAKAPTASNWRLGAAATLNKIGDVLVAQNNPWKDSLAVYRESLDGMRGLAEVDHGAPSARQAGELAAQYIPLILEKIGDGLRRERDLAGSLAAYREGLDITRELAAADPKSIQRKQDVLRFSNKFGEVLRSSEDFANARSAHLEGLDIARALAANDPSHSEWQMGIASSLVALALDGDSARLRLREALAIVNQLKLDGKLTSGQFNFPYMITAALEKETGDVLFYPMNDNANTLGILNGEYIRHGSSGKGVVSVSTPEGETLAGAYSIVEREGGIRPNLCNRSRCCSQGRSHRSRNRVTFWRQGNFDEV